jgi:hypothetical protein
VGSPARTKPRQCIGPARKYYAICWPVAVVPGARLASLEVPRILGGFPLEYSEPGVRQQDNGSIPQQHRWVRLCVQATRCKEWSKAGHFPAGKLWIAMRDLRWRGRARCRDAASIAPLLGRTDDADHRKTKCPECGCSRQCKGRNMAQARCTSVRRIAATTSSRKGGCDAPGAWVFRPRQSLVPLQAGSPWNAYSRLIIG